VFAARARYSRRSEKFSVIKTLQAIEDANVVVLVLDARENISEQDAHLAGFVLENRTRAGGRDQQVGWLSAEQRDDVKRDIGRKLAFLDFARFNYISALKGKGLETLLKDVEAAHTAAFIKMSTPKLTRVLEMAVEQHAPPKSGLFRPKPRYAHQGGKNPPVIVCTATRWKACATTTSATWKAVSRKGVQATGHAAAHPGERRQRQESIRGQDTCAAHRERGDTNAAQEAGTPQGLWLNLSCASARSTRKG